MRATFRESEDLCDTLPSEASEDPEAPETWRWLAQSPLELPTEREAAVLAGLGETSTHKGRVYRATFRPTRRADAARP